MKKTGRFEKTEFKTPASETKAKEVTDRQYIILTIFHSNRHSKAQHKLKHQVYRGCVEFHKISVKIRSGRHLEHAL